ncbi:MAG TPA: ligase-associated DNA damage response endonuclease PdeM [Paracoccaceae bacterium]|nr:ligase-associated DNA damage response endonuclease PdeM [Paracoccaceae bacterium]HMO71737.1 ligase-associated DNA damage response endonuclease PdeM [Paracoccaceae bacterium]
MTDGVALALAGEALVARGSGALWWPAAGTLTVADLHLGKSGRLARRGGALLPPYETQETLARLDADIATLNPARVICLGDSFDDMLAGEEMDDGARLWLMRLAAGREWVWIAGNHDPGPLAVPGSHRAEWAEGALVFRHAAAPVPPQGGEVSGHYHPKHGVAGRVRACFLLGGGRLILPAFGTYTGGLPATDPVLVALTGPGALAVLTGPQPIALPVLPHQRRKGLR